MNLLFFLLFSANTVYPLFEFGGKAGINYNNIDKQGMIYNESEKVDYSIDFSSGIIFNIHLNDLFYTGIEMLYNRKGFNLSDNSNGDIKVILRYLEFPMTFGIKTENLSIYLGMYISALLNSEESCGSTCVKSEINPFGENFDKVNSGLLFGLSYKINHVSFDMRYSRSFNKIYLYPNDYSGIDNFYQFIFSVIFSFDFNFHSDIRIPLIIF